MRLSGESHKRIDRLTFAWTNEWRCRTCVKSGGFTVKSFTKNHKRCSQNLADECQCFDAITWKSYLRTGPMWLLLLWAGLCIPAFAQRNTGTIVGLITDQSGA